MLRVIASTLKRRLAWGLGAAAALVAVLVAAALALIDTPAVQAELQRRLSAALGGQVSWQSLDINLFPAPHGELRALRVEVPGKMAAAADEVQVYLRLWPLLFGRVEVSSVALQRPRIRITPLEEGKPEGAQPASLPDPLALYRAALEPAARALREFAPDMAFRLDQASVEIGPGFALRDLQARARTDSKGIDLELAAAANLWQRLSIEGRVEYDDLAARAKVVLDALVLDKDVPPATLRANLRTDGRSALECDFDGSLGALVPAMKGRLLVPAGKPPQLTAELANVDLPGVLATARLKGAPLDVIESAEGRLSAKSSVSLDPAAWRAELEIVRSDAAVKLQPLPWKLAVHAGQVAVTAENVHVTGLKGSLGSSAFSEAALQIELTKPARLSAASGRATLELAQWLPWLRTKLPLEEIGAASGSVEVALHRLALPFDRPEKLDFDATVTPRKLSATLKALPAPVSVTGGTVRASAARVKLENVQGAVGVSTFSGLAAQIDLGKAPRVASASARATLELGEWFPWLQGKFPLEEIGALSGSVDIALERLALPFDRPAALDFGALATPRKVSATLKALPAPVSAAGGAIHVDTGAVRLDKVAVAMLDAAAQVSGRFAFKETALELALADGTAGEKIVRWALERAEVPPRFEPKTPLRFAARRIAWAPKGALEADASIDFERGPQLALVLAWRPERLELRRLAIKDARSDAVFGATVAGDRIQATFSGRLHGHSIPAMLRQPLPADSGTAQGELRVTIDRKNPEGTIAEGKLEIEALDLSWLAGKKALIERASLTAEPNGLRVAAARFSLEDQPFELRGQAQRTAQGPVIDARIESAGVQLDRLLPPPDPSAPKKKSSAIWPLPVSGRVEVKAGFVQHKEYRIEPFDGILLLEPKRARLEVKEARMCGVSFPMEVEVQPEDSFAAAHIRMQNEPLERAVRCLTGGNVEITGTANLVAELRVQGRRPHLVRGLTGTAHAELRDGRVNKFALLGNILSFRGIASVGDMKEKGFRYRSMTAKGRFEHGQFLVEEAFFDSDAVRLAATGRVDLLGPNSQLSVLVALLSRVERVVGVIPLVGDVFGGTMLALPIAVHGDIRNPTIVPLGPRAVTDQLLGIFERTLKLPGKLVVPPEAKP